MKQEQTGSEYQDLCSKEAYLLKAHIIRIQSRLATLHLLGRPNIQETRELLQQQIDKLIFNEPDK